MNTLTLKVRAEYLELPVSEYVGSHTLRFSRGGELLDDITVRLDYRNPTSRAYYPLSGWMGEEITVSVTPDIVLEDRQTDNPVRDRRDVFRPFLHYTPEFGWVNDPNGLLKYTSPVTGETVWHMFYQYNPYDWVWGNMHWGHAVSRDLIHWEELSPALCPDDDGTMFAGSAIVDRENRTGLKEGEEDVILLYYTCAGDTSVRSAKKKFTQCLAYSTDGGMTFKKYAKNPVVRHIKADNRDPKVVWCEELDAYLMAIYLSGHEYALLTSKNLLDWEQIQRIKLDRDAECPDIYPITVENAPSKRRWILSGASHRYLVGTFERGQFKPVQRALSPATGRSSYAAQTFSTDSEAERIQIAWDRDTTFGSAPLAGQMGFPVSLSLVEDGDGFFLCACPHEAIDTVCRDERILHEAEITEESPLVVPLEESAYELILSYDPEKVKGDLTVTVFGQKIVLENALNTIRIGKETLPIRKFQQLPRIRMLIDKGSVEIFTCGGRAMMTEAWMLNFNQLYASFSVEEGSARISQITLRRLMP